MKKRVTVVYEIQNSTLCPFRKACSIDVGWSPDFFCEHPNRDKTKPLYDYCLSLKNEFPPNCPLKDGETIKK